MKCAIGNHRTLVLCFLLALGVSNLHLVSGRSPQGMVFDVEAVIGGEWWRLVCHPFVHVGWQHLIWDVAAVSLLWPLLPNGTGARLGIPFLCAASSLAAALLWSPLIGEVGLCGLSGVAHGLAVAVGGRWLCNAWLGESAMSSKIGGGLLLTLTIAKSLVELVSGHSPMLSLVGDHFGTVIVHAHLGGVLGGLLSCLPAVIREV